MLIGSKCVVKWISCDECRHIWSREATANPSFLAYLGKWLDRCELESPAVEEESGKPLVALFEVFFSAGGTAITAAVMWMCSCFLSAASRMPWFRNPRFYYCLNCICVFLLWTPDSLAMFCALLLPRSVSHEQLIAVRFQISLLYVHWRAAVTKGVSPGQLIAVRFQISLMCVHWRAVTCGYQGLTSMKLLDCLTP